MSHSYNQLQNDYDQNNKIPFYMRLYPPLEISSQPKINLRNLLNIKNNSKNSIKNELLGIEKVEEEDPLNKEFLEELVNPSCKISKEKIEKVVSNYIIKSKLIEKIEDENKITKKINPTELSSLCAKKFIYIKVKRGDNVFKMGETGDKFYFILKGKVNILKLKEIPNLYMSIMEYLHYCVFLIESNENYLFQEVIQRNYNILQVTSAEEVLSLYKISFKKSLYDNIEQHLIFNNELLEEFFNAFKQKYSDYDIDKDKLDSLELNKTKKLQGSYKEWQNYLLKRFRLSTNELITYESFEQLIKDKKKKKIVCYVYDSYLLLGSGLYFGDFALDSDLNKRNATIRAEEDTYLGWLRGNDYINMIAPKRRYEKMKEIAFLYNNFFFQNINPHTLERNYFHLFYLKEYQRGTILFDSGKMPKNIYLVKKGQIRFDLKSSVIGLHKLIKFLYSKILNNGLYSKLSLAKKKSVLPPEITSEMHKYLKEPKLEGLKMQNNDFIKEMKKIQEFHITLLIGVDAVGLEEIFLKIPYIMKGTTMKNVICYEFSVEQIDYLLKEEKSIRYNFVSNSIKKILSLIERLQGIKKNCVEMANIKYNSKKESIFEKVLYSSEYFPPIRKKNNSSSINIHQNKNKNNVSENKLRLKNDINFYDNIYDILNKTNPNQIKLKSEEKKEVKINKEEEVEKNEENKKNEMKMEKLDENENNYKKIKLIFNKEQSRNSLKKYKSPIKDFIITQNQKYKTIFPSSKNNKMKNIKLIYNKRKRNKNNSYIEKHLSGMGNGMGGENLESEDWRGEGSHTKPKLDTGMNVKHLFLLGDKYYTINKLKKQIKDFSSCDNSKKRIEVIQSNLINKDKEDNNPIIPSNIKNTEIKKMNNINTLKDSEIKKNAKYSQDFKNFHLSFVPISASNENNNSINGDNNSFKNIIRNIYYSSYGDKFFKKGNYFLVNKKNKIYKKKYLNRINSDMTEYHKKLPGIQNDYINYNLREKNRNHLSSQIYSNKNIFINNNKNEFFGKYK